MELKLFYKNLIAFGALLFTALLAVDIASTNLLRRTVAHYTDSEDLISVNVGPDEINPYIDQAQSSDGTSKLILGDSVCHQLFNPLQEYNPDFLILGSNAAITMSGQYILAKEYLNNHSQTTDIYLIILPASMLSTYDTSWGYQYAVMPFVETGTLKDLDDQTIEIMEQTYGGALFLNQTVVNWIDDSAVNRKLYLNLLKNHSDGYHPENPLEIAERYILKLDALCQEQGVRLHLLSGPVSEANREYTMNIKTLYEKSPLYHLNPHFFEDIYYYPAEQSDDAIHFNDTYGTREHLNSVIQRMLTDDELVKSLCIG